MDTGTITLKSHDAKYAKVVLSYLRYADILRENGIGEDKVIHLDELGKALGIEKEEIHEEYEQLQLFDPDDYTIQVTPI